MALRLCDYLIRGELHNLEANQTTGWLELRGIPHRIPVQLIGNPGPSLCGKRIRFAHKPKPSPSVEFKDASTASIPDRFIGATGDMHADHQVRLFDCSIEEFLKRSKAGNPPETYWARCLYLEWYGNCGRVLIEIPDPQAILVEELDGEEVAFPLPPVPPAPFDPNDPPKADPQDIEIQEIQISDTGDATVTTHNPSDEEDPYPLYSDDLKKLLNIEAPPPKTETIDAGFGPLEAALASPSDGPTFRSIIGPTPDWDTLSDAEVEEQLKTAVAALALYNIACHICPHTTLRAAAQDLFENLADFENAHEALRDSAWFSTYNLSENCPQCLSEDEGTED